MTRITESDVAYAHVARRVAACLGLLALWGGAITLFGWAANIPRLTDWDGRNVSMFANTALAAFAAGFALFLVARGRIQWARPLAAIVFSIAFATLIEHVFSVNLGIDTLIVKSPWGTKDAVEPGRMGPPASICFTLLGLALFLAASPPGSRRREVAVFLALVAVCLALLPLMGYIYDADQLYSVPRYTGIAFQTSIILFFLGLGLIAAIPERQPARALCDDSAAGMLARRAIPFVLFVPMLMGWLRLNGQNLGLYDLEMGVAIFSLSFIAMSLAFFYWAIMVVSNREALIRDADRRKDEFLATLAHELRNPLAPIRTSLEILKLAPNDASTMEQARATMERQMVQLVRLTDDLLDVSRITRDKLTLQLEQVKLSTIIEQAVESTRPLIDAAKHRLHISIPPEPVYLDADRIRLTQVLGNLLTNACKYTPPEGQIWLKGEAHGDELILSVRDNGIGIPSDFLKSVFKMFAQADPTHERTQGGLGIGLTLVKRLTEMHGGTIEVHSHGEGQGTEFVVRLPVITKIAVRPDPESSSATAPAGPPRRVLIVDDNKDSAQSMAMLLNMAGNETRLAYDGVEAVQAAEQFQPDMVLLDLGLPNLNGLEACRQIRRQPWGKDVVLVALTGWGQDSDRRKSKEAGFDHHMVKPMDYAVLTKLLTSLPK